MNMLSNAARSLSFLAGLALLATGAGCATQVSDSPEDNADEGTDEAISALTKVGSPPGPVGTVTPPSVGACRCEVSSQVGVCTCGTKGDLCDGLFEECQSHSAPIHTSGGYYTCNWSNQQ